MTIDDHTAHGVALVESLGALADEDDRWSADDERRLRARLFDARQRRHASVWRRRLGRPATVAVAGVVIALGAGAATAAMMSRGEPASEEIDSFAADHGVSKQRALQAILDQRQLEGLTDDGRRRLGASFAGVWMTDGAIVFALTDDAPDSAERDAQDAIAARGLDGRVQLVKRRFSEADLLALQDTIMADIAAINRGAPSPIDIEIDPRANVVVVHRTAGRPTSAQAEYLAAVSERHGARVRIRESPGRLRLENRGSPR